MSTGERALATAPAQVPTPKVSAQAIQETKQQIALLQGMVRDLLERGIDYGRIPGIKQDNLWDPGASLIIGAFNCYPGERRVLSLRDDGEMIAVCLEVPLISRATGQVMATGVGAASTLETKYRYRWVNAYEAEELGFGPATLGTLKSKAFKDGERQYRIPNPEHGELLNTIFKMASKRGEVDAAQTLPGVASVLRQLFTPQQAKTTGGPKSAPEEGPVWRTFWGEVQRLGLTEEEARQRLKVKSMKDWLAQGRSLPDAIAELRRQLAEESGLGSEGISREMDGSPGDQLPPEGEEAPLPFEAPGTSKDLKPQHVLPMHPSTVVDVNSLFRVCNEIWKMQPAEVLKEANKARSQDIRPAECPRILAAIAVTRGWDIPKQ